MHQYLFRETLQPKHAATAIKIIYSLSHNDTIYGKTKGYEVY